MISKILRLSTLIILLFPAEPVLAQPDTVNGYSVQHFTDDNGLPQNSINDLLFDKDGYLWLASQVGLVRFNGSAFKLYYPDDKPVMESNIVSLGKDEKGVVYLRTDDHHLYCYGGSNDQFLHPVNTPAERRPLLLNTRKQLFDFSRFLAANGAAGDTARRRAIFQRLFDSPQNFYAADSIQLYLADRDSLYYFDGRLLQLLSPALGRGTQILLHDGRLFVLRRDSLVAAYNQGKLIAGPAPIEGDLLTERATRKLAPGSVRVYSCSHANHLLVDKRLYRLFPDKDGHIRSQFLVNLDFIPHISSVEYNAGLDLLLVSTHTEGFYFLRRNHFLLSGWPAPLQKKMREHLFGPLRLREGQPTAPREDNLSRPRREEEILTDKFIFTPAGAMASVPDSGAIWQRCLYIDGQQAVWAAHYDRPRRLTAAMDLVAEFPPLDANVVDYAEEPDGRLYCLTERSLWRLEGGVFRKLYTTSAAMEHPLNAAMHFVDANRLWIGYSSGLLEYDVRSNTGHPVAELDSTHVRNMKQCRDGSILIGTYGEGYFYYTGKRFFHMPLDKNGFLVTAHCFLEDSRGYIWIPCNKGLFKVPKADMDAWCKDGKNGLYYYYYGRQDGLLTNEFNGGFNACGVITRADFVTLLSMKGMVCFYTDSLKTDFPSGAIDMVQLEIDGQKAPRRDTLSLAAGYNSLVLDISCPYLGNRNNLYLQYQLTGLSEEWKPMPEDGSLNLSRLAPGRYTLRVRKVNGFGRNNYSYREWSIVVIPAFYRTSWFLTLMLLVVIALLVVAVQQRLKLKEKKKEIREKGQALLKTSKQREKLISLVIHDLRSPLRFLTILAGDLYDNQAKFSPEEIRDRTWWVKKGAQDIYNFSDDFLLWVTSQKESFKASKQLFFVRPLLQEIDDFYADQVRQKGNRLHYDADERLQVYSDPHLLITILRNLTDNANKYTNEGDIRITARQEDGQLLIIVADTGRGMSPEQAAAFMGAGNPDNVKSGTQLGHKFVVDLTQRLNGRIVIGTHERKGTTVTLRIPMEEPPPQ